MYNQVKTQAWDLSMSSRVLSDRWGRFGADVTRSKDIEVPDRVVLVENGNVKFVLF